MTLTCPRILALVCPARGLFLLALACGEPSGGSTGGSESSGGSTGGSTTGASTGGSTGSSGDEPTGGGCPEAQVATDDCCCFELTVEDGGATTGLKNTCPSGATPCEGIETKCVGELPNDGSCPGDEFTIEETEAEAVACVLDVLRAGAPARVGWSIVHVPGFAGSDASVYITSAQDVIQTTRGYVDLSSHVGEVGRFDLPPATFFDDCAAMATTFERFKCLKSFLDEAPMSTCSLD